MVLCFALFCVYNVFVGWRAMSTCKGGGGVVDENGGMVARGKVPVYSKYMAVYFRVYGRILHSIRQEYFSNTLSILTNTLKSVDCQTHTCGCMEWALCFFYPPPPNFQGAKLIF